jgi:hypothetical protein
MVRVRAPGRSYRPYANTLELLFHRDLLVKIFERTTGVSGPGEYLEIAGSPNRQWRAKHMVDPRWRRWYNPRKCTSLKFTEHDVDMTGPHFFRNPQAVTK